MAFHVACPITSRRICFCKLGFPQKLQSEKGRKDFLEEVSRLEEFLSDPWSIRAKEKKTVQVLVPRIVVPPPPPQPTVVDGFGGAGGGGGGGGGGDGYGGDGDGEELLSVQSKRAAMQKKAVEALLAAEDYARRFERGSLEDISGETVQDLVGEDQGSSTVKVMCRICFDGENVGSARAIKMLACKICDKKYHKSCLKSWGQHRDLFHLSSWVCPSCRTCEICRRTGDPTKFMFCKRCDGAYHCYCQHPPHKNVTSGLFLCPKHTRCHSCESTVPGNGLSTRWFLGYTCCDACGRLFVKGNYCPVCLKVYRDSESTPMVCCDVCQRWVHCLCDGISDEKYMQFQADRNLHYKCAACRGECYQVKDPDDAVQELWRRRDRADRDQIASLRIAAGLPPQEDKFSDDEEYSPIILKHEHGRSLKFSVKGSIHKVTKNTKEYGKKSGSKKYGKKKGYKVSSTGKTEGHQSFDRLNDRQSFEFSLSDEKNDGMQSYRNVGQEIYSSPTVRSGDTKEKCSINQAGIVKHNFIDEVAVRKEDKAPRVIHFKSSKLHGADLGESIVKQAGKQEAVKGTKLVIHLGGRNRNVTNSPRSETSSCHREQDLTASNGGSEGTSQQKANDKKPMVERNDGIARHFDGKGEKLDNANQMKSSKYKGQEGSLIKLGKMKSDISDSNPQTGFESIREGYESTAVGKTAVIEPETESLGLGHDEVPLRRHSKSTPNIRSERHENNACTNSGLDSLPKDPKPLLKLKFKNPYIDNRNSWVPHSEEEKSSIKGQRSKRKRPSPLLEKTQVREDDNDSQERQDNPINEVMEANWILKKLGKDAIGKRVEVHQLSDGSWHKGVVTNVTEGTSMLAVHLDDGRDRTLDLEKHGVRFVSQKQKRLKP